MRLRWQAGATDEKELELDGIQLPASCTCVQTALILLYEIYIQLPRLLVAPQGQGPLIGPQIT